MKTAGIVGGIAPESTIQYYRLMVDLYREKISDGSYPPILINSIDMTRMLDLIGKGELPAVTDYLLGEVEKLADGGADFAFLASNTPHIVFKALQARSPLPLISIVEAARDAVQAQGLKKVGLFGTRFTMEGGFYTEAFEAAGITIVTPDEANKTFIHDKYMGELVNGIFKDETRAQLLKIVDQLRQQDHVEGIVLGGTELPLILTEPSWQGLPFFDTTRIHAEQAVRQILS